MHIIYSFKTLFYDEYYITRVVAVLLEYIDRIYKQMLPIMLTTYFQGIMLKLKLECGMQEPTNGICNYKILEVYRE